MIGSSLYANAPHILKDHVRFFWQSERRNCSFNRETIIPKGMVEVIFNLDQSFVIQAAIGARDFQIPRCFISAHHTFPVRLQLPTHQSFFGIVLHATTLRKLFRSNIPEFVNQCVDLTLVDASLHSLWHQFAEETSFQNRVDLFSTWLIKRLPEKTAQEFLLDQFLDSNNGHFMTIKELSEALCYSPRHMSRKLHELTGLNSEKSLLFRKYAHSVRLMDRSPMSLTEIAYACRFTDQPHFIKTFKSYSGINPGEYRKRKSPLSGHILENVR